MLLFLSVFWKYKSLQDFDNTVACLPTCACTQISIHTILFDYSIEYLDILLLLRWKRSPFSSEVSGMLSLSESEFSSASSLHPGGCSSSTSSILSFFVFFKGVCCLKIEESHHHHELSPVTVNKSYLLKKYFSLLSTRLDKHESQLMPWQPKCLIISHIFHFLSCFLGEDGISFILESDVPSPNWLEETALHLKSMAMLVSPAVFDCFMPALSHFHQ